MIIAIIVFYAITALMIAYCTDYPTIPSDIDLTMPSIRDLDFTSDGEDIDIWKFRQIADTYVEDVIRPATLYFIYHKKIAKETDPGSDLLKFAAHAFCAVPMFLFFTTKLKNIGFLGDSDFLYNVVGGIITVAICIGIILAIYKLYDKLWSIPKLAHSQESLKKGFSNSCSEYPINENRAFMNYVIMLYYRYLSYHHNSIERKKTTLYIACTIGTIIWFALLLWLKV